MNAHEKLIKRRMAVDQDHDFAIQDKLARRQLCESLHKFGEISAERLPGFRLQEHLLSSTVSQAAEAVPLGLVHPTFARRYLLYRLRVGRRERRPNGKINSWKRLLQFLGRNGTFADPIGLWTRISSSRCCHRGLGCEWRPQCSAQASHPVSSGCYTDAFMLRETLEKGREIADAALEKLLPPPTQYPPSIHEAMRHSVFAGGKRLRPILCLESARMIAGKIPRGVEEVGAALEMLHTYSLIHDDLPALDNDDLRRGRPTCHKVFGEAIAILAGDALQTYAYEVLSRIGCEPSLRVRIIEEIAHGTGTIDGMIGGQVVDLEAEHKKPDIHTLEYIHRAKTAALITASIVSGGIYAGADEGDIARLRCFGQGVGL